MGRFLLNPKQSAVCLHPAARALMSIMNLYFSHLATDGLINNINVITQCWSLKKKKKKGDENVGKKLLLLYEPGVEILENADVTKTPASNKIAFISLVCHI